MSATAAPFRLPDAPAETDLVAKYFRGLGDPIRLRILDSLHAEGELTVGQLVERLGVAQPKVSNHLACLRWCGFIEARREHRTVFNKISDKHRSDARPRSRNPCRQRRTRRRMLPDRRAPVSEPLVEVLTFEGCPHAEPALELVRRVLAESGIGATVRRVDVPDAEAAAAYLFLGSPTIRVNGRDIEPGVAERDQYVLSCRVYRTQSGLKGEPDEEWLCEALSAAG